ncbi:hypothetical protein [Algoriphagus antarcticus]|uniref:hypothetical protein n=1 Tax=Algoriphagus antarcticus TaxID=238540 RepID=UPI0011243893|nr:hypothetical protein [Algoriphagus antarcticus]
MMKVVTKECQRHDQYGKEYPQKIAPPRLPVQLSGAGDLIFYPKPLRRCAVARNKSSESKTFAAPPRRREKYMVRNNISNFQIS